MRNPPNLFNHCQLRRDGESVTLRDGHGEILHRFPDNMTDIEVQAATALAATCFELGWKAGGEARMRELRRVLGEAS